MTKILYLGIGSLAGGLARYFLAGTVHKSFGTGFPYGTLAVNLLGCFAIGFLGAVAEERFFLGPEGKILLMTGFCGAFTTFSTFMFETGNLMKDGEFSRAFLNVAASLVAGFAVYRLGILLGQRI
ncbi:MAG: fluoride efflux transporter CrcB [Candidatus Omnitrophica bacterium]|nr:fluoride efflux transporter CrcB [Candidatus Omnitrophota bacterium]